ncbi:MAG: F0F1 ATP synthase subunit delta [Rhodobacteraceae bacterium]|nr:F0F1 ATP synthase subunit delta [Paracoccaceae bacterium]
MSQSSGLVSGVSGRYASALFELAEEGGNFDAIASDVTLVREALEASPELLSAISNPSISRAEMGGVVASLAARAGLGDVATKFLGLMAAKRRLKALPSALEGFELLAADKRGEATVEVVSATALSEMQTQTLSTKLEHAVGRKIHIKTDVDPELIGGLIVKIGSKMIDASVRSKLSALQHAMKEAG